MNDKNLPLYTQVANEMRKAIRVGKWKVGEKILTEHELCDLFHVSRITVRAAIDELTKENLLVKKRSIGTFVVNHKNLEKEIYTIVKGFTKEMKELGIEALTRKVSITYSYADLRISKFLNINPGDPVLILRRIRGDKDKIFAYFITYFKYKDYFSTISSDYSGSFYKYLSSLGIKIEEDQEIVEATLPSRDLAHLLKVNKNTPILKRSRFTSDKANNFYEFTECYYVGSDYRYFLNFSKNIYDIKQ